jgi:prepilin-type N-terminal cleavage/methylation domain-containing protein
MMITTSDKGFTVIELLIGVMIVAILGVVAAPQFTGLLQRFRLNGATRAVWGDLHKARLMAIKESTAMTVNFAGNSYNITRTVTGQVALQRNLAQDYPGITVSITNNAITFGSTGAAGGGSQTVQVQSSAGTKSFTVLTTGRIGSVS